MTLDINVSRLNKTFQTENGETVAALCDIDLGVQEGQFYVLVGDSGSGKTTLMRSIAGLEVPDSGEIELRGRSVYSVENKIFVPPQERQIGMVFQSYAIWPHLTVYDNIALPLLYGRHRPPRGEVRARVGEALEIVGLAALADRPAPNLSGGQQQRVALARAIAVSSKLLLMDEPMSNLDARLRNEVRTQIRSIVDHYGTTVVYVTHDQEEAMSLADQMALMRDGTILQRGTPEDLYDRSISREVAEFFGPMNMVAGEVVADGVVRTALGPISAPTAGLIDRAVVVGLRPEKVEVAPRSGESENVFDAVITDRVFLGGVTVHQINLGEVSIRADNAGDFRVGDGVRIRLPSKSLRVFPAARHAVGTDAAADEADAHRIAV